MTIQDLIDHPGEWLNAKGPHSDIVVSSRIRLARNLERRPFPGWSKKAERIEVLKQVKAVAERLPSMDGGLSATLEALAPLQKQILVERHLISREHAAKGIGSGLVISPEQTVSLMINEEDHLRMQAIRPGLQLKDVFGQVDDVDTKLEQQLDYAFHPELGYLTACPTNVGTGMRASAMLHLPALVMGDQISKIVNSVNKIGLAVRGLHGEGSEAIGNLFQISNQTTLGESEQDIIERLERVILQIIEHECNARGLLIQHKPLTLFDQLGRAYGILRYAHSLSSKEALNLLSLMKLGIDLGIFPDTSFKIIDELFIETQPAHLQKGRSGKKMSAEQRDTLRAARIRATVSQFPEPAIDKIQDLNSGDESAST